jgi:AraC-like DNA-binding protein
MQPDVLSDVCSNLRLRSDFYFTAEMQGAFCVRVPAEGARIRFHLVLVGGCRLLFEDRDLALDLGPGDLVLVPNGKAHILADAQQKTGPANVIPVDLAIAMAHGFDPQTGILRNRKKVSNPAPGDMDEKMARQMDGQMDGPTQEPTHGQDADMRMLCGFCAFDEAIRHPGLALIDDHVVLRGGDRCKPLQQLPHEPPHDAPHRAVLAAITDLATSRRPGWQAALARLVEVVVLEILGSQLGKDDLPPGVLAGLADPRISRALTVMHRNPEQDWNAESLARHAGMSRTRFVVRFGACVGVPPMQYLQDWRMIRARTMLRDTNLSMDEVALRCGYQSMPAFSRRFKARFGEGPGGYRRSLRKQSGAG